MGQIVFSPSGFYVEEANNQHEQALKNNPYLFLYNQAFLDEKLEAIPAFDFLLNIARVFVKAIQHDGEIEITRHYPAISDAICHDLIKQCPFVIGSEFVNLAWIQAFFARLGAVFNAEISQTQSSVENYLQSKNQQINVAGRVYFHLVESKQEDFPFAFMATYATGDKNKISHLPLQKVLQEFDDQSEVLKLLSAVSNVVKQSPFISELVESGELFHPIQLTTPEAYVFLKETPIYEQCGVTCRIPNFWKKETKRQVKLSVGFEQPNKVGLDSLLACQPQMHIGDEQYSEAEINEFLAQSEGLAFLKGKWVEINHEKLQALLSTFKSAQQAPISFLDALRLDAQITQDTENQGIEVQSGQWLASVKDRLLNPSMIQSVRPDDSFKAMLRPYQQTGYNWLNFMADNRFGALLADDMGLGKTVQVLALLNQLQQENAKILLVIPASLMDNWRKEAQKFAPNLRLQTLMSKNDEFDLEEADLFISTYGMVAKVEGLMQTTFDWLILDEAQAIKNAGTQQTKNIKMIQATHKLALTGTPIENNLGDLWSLFDFLNKGLLGSSKEFMAFLKKSQDYGKIRQLISPFILRRLKTDKSIISDLPEKIENKEYVTLTKKQIALYQDLQKDILSAIVNSDDIQRRGIVLSAITKFKQICNHPDQYLGNRQFDAKHSGKFDTLKTLCETIRDKHERVLIFTQFKEMCEPLDDFLADIFGTRGLVLHGGTSVKKRGTLVDQFNQADVYTPYMVLSLKAGGVGLNLTSANHVIHFDRWWNPAIENQATDRAFRIGQQKNVLVYKFVTSGSIEEKIDELLNDKAKLSGDLISESDGEHWLSKMSNDELGQLFSLEVE